MRSKLLAILLLAAAPVAATAQEPVGICIGERITINVVRNPKAPVSVTLTNQDKKDFCLQLVHLQVYKQGGEEFRSNYDPEKPNWNGESSEVWWRDGKGASIKARCYLIAAQPFVIVTSHHPDGERAACAALSKVQQAIEKR